MEIPAGCCAPLRERNPLCNALGVLSGLQDMRLADRHANRAASDVSALQRNRGHNYREKPLINYR